MTVLEAAEGLSSLVVLCVIVVWFTLQIIKSIREGKTASGSLAENTIKLLAEEQRKTYELNERVDNLYAENRTLRYEIFELKNQYRKLQDRHEKLVRRVSDSEDNTTGE